MQDHVVPCLRLPEHTENEIVDPGGRAHQKPPMLGTRRDLHEPALAMEQTELPRHTTYRRILISKPPSLGEEMH